MRALSQRWRRKRAIAAPVLPPLPAALGRWGTHEFIEPQVRRLVANHLGVSADRLEARVSLRQDLAADSLDLVELALLLESEFGIALSDGLLDDVQSYGDLVDGTVDLILTRDEAGEGSAVAPSHVKTRLQAPRGRENGTLDQAGLLTPYLIETVTEQAQSTGRGARLDVDLAPGASDAEVTRVRGRLASLAAEGIRVRVASEARVPPPKEEQCPPAA
jgi:acyl carrier protein